MALSVPTHGIPSIDNGKGSNVDRPVLEAWRGRDLTFWHAYGKFGSIEMLLFSE
jgi:hypothetical protein